MNTMKILPVLGNFHFFNETVKVFNLVLKMRTNGFHIR